MSLNRKVIFNQCRHYLHGHGPSTIQKALLAAANFVDPHTEFDVYGRGELIERFEQKVARYLGVQAGVFMPSGTMAQQIAARIFADRAGISNIGMHSTSHLLIHEEDAFAKMHGLKAIVLGDRARTLRVSDLEKIRETVSSVIIELPQRHNGGALPSWNELTAMSQWCRQNMIKFHLDGARLWECGSFYSKPLAEICSLFDSVYVSFYKGLGGMGGAMLLGQGDFVDESRVWLRRHGGNLVHLYPLVVSADLGFETKLPKMPQYFALAQKIAKTLRQYQLIQVNPNPVHTNMMHLTFDAPQKLVEETALATSANLKTWLLGNLWNPPVYHKVDAPTKPVFEWYIGDGALQTSYHVIEEFLAEFHGNLLKEKSKC